MNNLFFKIKCVAVLFTFSLFISCDKDDEASVNTAEITQADVQTSLEVQEISSFVDGITLDNLSFGNGKLYNISKNNNCSSFSINNSGYTISFNDCNFQGNSVSGSMTVTVNLDNNVFTSTIVFDNLTYGGNQINGSKTSNYSLNTNGGNITYSITSDIAIVFENGDTASENGTKNYEITGLGSSNGGYAITGNWNITHNTDAYSVATNPSIAGTFDCNYITSGVLTITDNGADASVNFGDGTCDNNATVTLPNGTTQEIEL